MPANKKTYVDKYFDTGWIQRARDPGNPPATYAYAAEGWQTERIPWLYCVSCTGGFAPDEAHRTDWEYSALGRVTERRRSGAETASQTDTFNYDSHGLLTDASLGVGLSHAVSGTALVGQATDSRLLTETQYDTLDRPTKTRHWKETDDRCRYTTFVYDRNGNLTERGEDGEEQLGQEAGVCTTTQLAAPTTRTLAYDVTDRLVTDTVPDTRVTLDYWPATGRLKQRKVETGSGGSTWAVQQTVDYDPFANGQLYRQTTKNGATPATTTEEHVLSYESGGIYVGHRTQDVFTLQSPTSTVCPSASTCTATITYDPRGRLVASQDGHGGGTAYTLDPLGNVTRESVTAGGGGATVVRNFTYSHAVHAEGTPSNQLEKIEDDATPRATLAKHFYDARGNLKCVTTGAWEPPAGYLENPDLRCPAVEGGQTTSAALLEHYVHDDFDRLLGTTGFVSTTVVRSAQYTYDPLDRPIRQTERHTISGTLTGEKTRAYTYQSLTNAVTKEQHYSGSDTTGSLIRTKTYALDAFGRPTTLDNDPTTPTADDPDARYTYSRDVHGSISQLLDGTGAVKASYGYRPYGKADPDLTKGDLDLDSPAAGTDPLAALSPYRYTGKRHDPASRSLDMGARRFGPDPGRFLQQDLYRGALANLRLSVDPLTQNRYALAGGNPISFVEVDGHYTEVCPSSDPLACGEPAAPPDEGPYGPILPLDPLTLDIQAPATQHPALPALPPTDCLSALWESAQDFSRWAYAFAQCARTFGLVPALETAGGGQIAGPPLDVPQGVLEEVLGIGGLGPDDLGSGVRRSEGGPTPPQGVPSARTVVGPPPHAGLPQFTGGKTSGILDTGSGEIFIISGYSGPASSMPMGSPGFNRITRGHVEGHASAIMHQQGLSEATLYVNNPPCRGVTGCTYLLPRMLPEGAKLRVIGPDGFDVVYVGVAK